MIQEVKGQYNPAAIEEKQRQFWEKNRIPHKLSQFLKGRKKFYLLDGPPYVNATAHVGHIKTRAVKDIYVKLRAMQGFNAWMQPGFDTHGLPIENMVEKSLNLSSKKDIEKYGVDKFIETCKKFATGNEKEWLGLYKLLGDFRGWFEPYLTYENYYIESAWWTVKQLAAKGMLVQGDKPIFWCPHCETALAGYEVSDSYADVKDPYIYVKFPIKGKQNEYIVVFTTTPWTLAGNVAIAVHPDEYYVRVRVGKETLIIAEKRAESVLKDLVKTDYEVLEKFLGKELEGLRYLPVLDVPSQQKLSKEETAHRIYLSIPVLKSKSYKHGLLEKAKVSKEEFFNFVNAGEGSGAVHTAPGHGPEDHYIGQHYKLPTVSPVDELGKFTADGGEFRGMFVKDADKIIAEKLQKKNLLLHFGWVTHAYPLCWRCKSPLIYRVSKQWFLSIDSIKSKMIKENKKVRWLPEFGRERFHNWLVDAVDWCISQQRYWGIPLPLWICEKCGKISVVGSAKELQEKSNKKLPKDFDLHKHVVDKILLTCDICKSTMRRVPDTMNVWFDSGIAAWASLGYPYRNKELFENLWPTDFISEAQDQIRGWFYSLMFCGVAAFNKSPYDSVGLLGWVLDAKGEKMSKSLGNVVWATEAFAKLGADILRLYYCWEVAPWEIQNFSFKTAEEVRRALNILWNSYSFFTTYADKEFKPNIVWLRTEDRWILSKVNSLITEVTEHFEKFELHHAGRKLTNFVVSDLSRFYIKLIRDRVWVTEKGRDKQVALSTLYKVLVTLSKLFAPITPFISEEIYQNLVYNFDKKAPQSVFQSGWPKIDKRLINKDLEQKISVAQEMIEACQSARQQAKIKLRWPISEVVIGWTGLKVTTELDAKLLKETMQELNDLLKFMCNAKKISYGNKMDNSVEITTDTFKLWIPKTLDKKLLEEALIREVIRKVQSMRKENSFNVKETITLSLNSSKEVNEILSKSTKLLSKEVGAKKVSVGKLSGKFKGKLDFDSKEIDIAFDK